jgi:hypothetical protein
MSKSAKIYGSAALVLIAFPLLVALWGGTSSAIIAILLIGAGGYGFVVCLLLGSFWYRFRRGTWPLEFAEGTATSRHQDAGAIDGDGTQYRVRQPLLGWLKKPFSNV